MLKLTFFKESGKYYTEEVMPVSSEASFWECLELVKRAAPTPTGMHILVEGLPNDVPTLIPCCIKEIPKR